jgi:hypothetical protein
MSATPSFNPGGVPDGARRRIQASTRLLHEWSIMQPWEAPPIYELRIGPTPLVATSEAITPAIARMLRNFNRYADMIGITPAEIQVIEAKMVAEPGAISQLQHYVALVHTTPQLAPYAARRVQGVLLFAVGDPIVAQRAQQAGLRVIIFTPAWTQEYLNLKYFRRQSVIPAVTPGGPNED